MLQLSVHVYNRGTLLEGPTDSTYLVSLIPEGQQWAPSNVKPMATKVIISFESSEAALGAATVKLCRFTNPNDCQRKVVPNDLPASKCNHK